MTDKIDAASQQYKNASQQVDADNTVQRIYNTIKDLTKYPDAMRKRWVWELLQNAHDAKQVEDKRSITIKIRYSKGELVFLHNGKGFNASEIAHVIKSGSTKDEADETTHGQYGTGLLTTHLLSPKMQISGLFQDSGISIWFDFPLVRDDDSPEALRKSLDKAEKSFNCSFSQNKPSKLGDFTTRFGLPICEEDAQKTVRTGIETLKQSAPYVLIFNETFRSITIEDHEGTLCFEVVALPKPDIPIQQIIVMEHKNGNANERGYLLSQDKEKTSVIVPLELNKERNVCLSVDKTPRLFKGLPLVDTESFSFPAVINNPNFTVPSTRDNLPLEESNENKKNRDIIKKACALFVSLVEHAALNKWYHLPRWVKVPPIENQSSSGMNWLKTDVLKNLIKKIRETDVVLNADENAIASNAARLPLLNAENCEGVEVLWDLLENVQGFRETLPRREEATGWCNAIKSWADVYQDEPMSLFSEVTDGTKLASFIQESTRKDDSYGRIEDLQDLLLEEEKKISAVEWLNQLHDFFNENRLRDAVREYYIVIDQAGFLDQLSALHRDPGIDKELKEIAEVLGWSIRQKLRDIRLTSLSEEGGYGDMSQDEVVNTLRQKLRDRADENPDNDFKEACKRLFAWIVLQEDWDRLRGFPVFTDDSKSNSSPVLHLPSAHTNKPLLAPVRAWAENLEPFSELFPPERILADAFYEAAPKLEVWEQLDKRNFIKSKKIIIDSESSDLRHFSPDAYKDEDDQEQEQGIHETQTLFATTTVIEWNEIMAHARGSRENAYLFWRFLTEYLIKEDSVGLEEKFAQCSSCKKRHKYYPAAWLKAVRRNKWIRLEGTYFRADALSLAKLLSGKWELRSLNDNPDVGKLLNAMNVQPSDLKRSSIPDEVIDTAFMLSENPQLARHMEDNEKRHQIEQILDTAGDDLPLVNKAVHDEKFLEEYKKKKKQDIIIQSNKNLGLLVEKRVGKILSKEGFNVKSHDRGWDFDMTGHITELKVVQNSSSKTWRVEVKTTRTEDNHQGVYMSSAQAEEAVKYGKQYLLCVVPLGQEDASPENVAEKILFIENIGNLVAPLCANLDRLKEVRDDITTDTPSDLKLIVEEGKPRVLVKKPVWDKVGFPLADLLERLRNND